MFGAFLRQLGELDVSTTTTDDFAKSGEQKLQITIRRGSKGIRVTIRAAKEIEEHFREQVNDAERVNDFARAWVGSGLSVWSLSAPVGSQAIGGQLYTIERPGQSLLAGDDVVNISFLRLVGISEPQGVTFEVRGAFSVTFVQNLVRKLTTAAKAYYTEFLRPINVTISMVTQENRG
jgi:hypothetical protein